MIKNILIPEKLGSYYIFPKRVVGFEITKQYLFATITTFNQSNIIIEQCLQIPIEQENKDVTARTVDALKKVGQLTGKNISAHISLSCSQVVFKTLKLPFDEYEKIKRVIAFEVEPLLPFSINEAVVDFIITKQYPEEKSAEVLVAAIQKQFIYPIIDLFAQAQIMLESATIDMFSLYSLYKIMPTHAHNGGTVLIDIGTHITKLAYVFDGQLLFIRTLPFGVAQFTKALTAQTSKNRLGSFQELLQTEFSSENEHEQALAQQALEPFINKITLTLQSFTGQSNPEQIIKQILLSGTGATIKGLDLWFNKTFSIACKPLIIEAIPEEHITLKNMHVVPIENNISCATTIATPNIQQINMLQHEFAPHNNSLFLKQLIVACTLTVLLLTTLSIFNFLQIHSFKNEITASKNEATENLHEWFPSLEEGHLDDMIEEAQKLALQEEKIWFAFDRSKKHSFLNFLLELSHLDRQGLGLVFDRININQDTGTMLIKAQVKGHEALKPLENELEQTKLFTDVQPQENPNFTMELHFTTGQKGE